MLHSAFRNYFDASALPPQRKASGARRESMATADPAASEDDM